MVRVTFGPRQEVLLTDYNAFSFAQEYRYEFETVSYRLLDTADSPTEYEESVHTLKIGTDTMYVAIKVEAKCR